MVETEEDSLIYDSLAPILNNEDVDGRYFRDNSYGYDYLRTLVPEDLLTDYNICLKNTNYE
jgi:hypothetical protein